jgi:hypothetical protein
MVESALEEWRIGAPDLGEPHAGGPDLGEPHAGGLDLGEPHAGGLDFGELDFLFIENVGNLVCPSSYDLGEDLRLVLLSVTEGEDKPLKYPTIFHTADVAIVTKMDLAQAVEFDSAAADSNIQRVRPGMQVFRVSSKSNFGMDHWMEFLTVSRTIRAGREAKRKTSGSDGRQS